MSLIVLGLLRGHAHLNPIVRQSTRLSQQQRRTLRLPTKKGGKFRRVPGYDVFREVLHRVDLEALATTLTEWMQSHAGELPRNLAVDGKMIRDRLGLVVTLVDTETGAPVAVSADPRGKGHEMKLTQRLLASDAVNLRGAVVTADSLHCQGQSARCITREKGGDYILQVRANQPSLEEREGPGRADPGSLRLRGEALGTRPSLARGPVPVSQSECGLRAGHAPRRNQGAVGGDGRKVRDACHRKGAGERGSRDLMDQGTQLARMKQKASRPVDPPAAGGVGRGRADSSGPPNPRPGSPRADAEVPGASSPRPTLQSRWTAPGSGLVVVSKAFVYAELTSHFGSEVTGMKRGSTIFLRIIIVLVGVGALALMLWFPHIEGRNLHATTFQVYFQDPFLAYAYTASLAFYLALYQAFRVLALAGRNRIFSPPAVQAVQTIKHCALAMLGFVLGALVLLFLTESDDRAGGVALGVVIALGSIAIAAAAAMFEQFLRKAVPFPVIPGPPTAGEEASTSRPDAT